MKTKARMTKLEAFYYTMQVWYQTPKNKMNLWDICLSVAKDCESASSTEEFNYFFYSSPCCEHVYGERAYGGFDHSCLACPLINLWEMKDSSGCGMDSHGLARTYLWERGFLI